MNPLPLVRRSSVQFLALALVGSVASAQVPETRLDVGTPAGTTHARGVVIASSGSSVYVAWEDDRNGVADVYFNRSLDGGATWLGVDVRLDAGSSNSRSPVIACSGSDVYVLWTDDRNGCGDLYLNRSVNGGGTWLESDMRVDSATGAGTTCSSGYGLAAAGSSVYACWTETNTPFPTGATTVRFRGSTNNGVSWGTDTRIDVGLTGTFKPLNPVIAASGANVYVAWHSVVGAEISPEDVYVNASLDGGTTWLAQAARVDVGTLSGEEFAFSPRIAASGASVYVAWLDHRSGEDVYLNRSLDGGASWLLADVQVNDSSSVNPGQLTLETTGSSVFATWQDDRTGVSARGGSGVAFNRSLDSGTTWLASDTILNAGAEAQGFGKNIDVAAEGASVFVAWLEYRADHTSPTFGGDISFNRSIDDGTSWLPEDRTIDSGSWPYTSVDRPVPVVAASGSSAYVAWSDPRSGSNDAFFAFPLGYQTYGAGTPGTGGVVPSMSGSGQASIGALSTIHVDDGLGGAPCLVVYTFAGPAAIPSVYGTLLVAQPWRSFTVGLGGTPGVAGAGSKAISRTIKDDVSVLGRRVDFQAAVFDAGGTHGIALSNGLEIRIL